VKTLMKNQDQDPRKTRTRTRTKVKQLLTSLPLLPFLTFIHLVAETKEGIEDRTETNLVNLRRVIYLTIMNALNYEEAVHKLLKIQIQEGEEVSSYPSILTLKFRRN